FRHPAEAGADRRLGQQAVAAAGKPFCLRAGHCESRREAYRRRGAAAAGLERLAHRATAIRILARPPVPPARPHRIPPRQPGRSLVEDAALSLTQAFLIPFSKPLFKDLHVASRQRTAAYAAPDW